MQTISAGIAQCLVGTLSIVLLGLAARAEPPAEPAPLYSAGKHYQPSPDEWNELRVRHDALAAEVRRLEGRARSDLFGDVAIFPKSVAYLLRFRDRFFRRGFYKDALELMALGQQRAAELARGAASWPQARGTVIRGYHSNVDGSFQPYAVHVPDDYDPHQPMRLDVILHGRNRTINEVNFLTGARTGRITRTETGGTELSGRIKLYVFGRGNTSYRWAGEADVFEALTAVRQHYNIDPDRIVLRGFSMGGAGAWQLGLHFPSRWAAVEAGAGYVETRPEVLATIHDTWRQTSLAIHDASNYAENLLLLPFVAYAGSLDPTIGQNEIIQRRIAAAGVDLSAVPTARFFVAEGVGHQFRPDLKQESEVFITASLPRHRPDSFVFVTHTPSYGEFWDFHVDSLSQLYERAEIRGTWDKVSTRNIWVLRLNYPRSIELDGQRLTGNVFEHRDGRWRTGEPLGLRKRAGLQGPIDDAFQQPFLCVPPSEGRDAELDRFRDDFAKFLYGDIRIKAAVEVTTRDIADYNLVLFGTPETNPLIRQILSMIPVRWTDTEIGLGPRTFSAAGNTLVLIYPNPLNPRRYVVLNSGHTFRGRDFDDMHWFLHPHLADYAVVDVQTREVKTAGFFDRTWQLP